MVKSNSAQLIFLLISCSLMSCASDSRKDLFIQEMHAAYEVCPTYTRGDAHAAMECRVNGQRGIYEKYYPESAFTFDEWAKVVLQLSKDYDDGKISRVQYHKGWDNALKEWSEDINLYYASTAPSSSEPDIITEHVP